LTAFALILAADTAPFYRVAVTTGGK
jgi:hypothetical protein